MTTEKPRSGHAGAHQQVWIQNAYNTHTMEVSSDIKKRIMQLAGKWMEVNIFMVNEKSLTQTSIAFSRIYVYVSWHRERQKNAVL